MGLLSRDASPEVERACGERDVAYWQMALNGIFMGMGIMLVALGLTLVLGVAHIFNLVHTQFYMIAAYILWWLFTVAGLSFWLAVAIAVVIAAALGVLLERFILRRFKGNLLPLMIVCVGLILALETTPALVFGPSAKSLPSLIKGVIHPFGLYISLEKLLVILVSAALIIIVIFFIRWTKMGLAMRAIAEDTDAAALHGISENRIVGLTMAIGCGLAAIAAGMFSTVYMVAPTMGTGYLFSTLLVIILGGFGSVSGCVIAAFLVGMIQSYTATLVSPAVAGLVLFSIVFVWIMLRPRGLVEVE